MRLSKPILWLAVVFGVYWAWSQVSTPYGDQVVTFSPATKECFAGSLWKACIYRSSKQSNNADVAYYLHGRNLSENVWNDADLFTGQIQKYWQDHGIHPPTVVAVSFGGTWLLTPKGEAPNSGLLDVFLNDVIKSVEHKTGEPRRRLVFGDSMGGVNSLVLGMSRGDLFAKVASSCPVIHRASPFDSFEKLFALVKRTGADPKTVFGIMQLTKFYFANEQEWNRFSPIQLVESIRGTQTRFYLSCGLYDKYGNYEGNEYLASRAQELGVSLEWHPLYGGHCATDITSLAKFLVE